MGSLLRPGIIKAVTSALDEQFVERTVFFPVFTRYFLARGRSFKIMIEDLLKHREASQNNKPPLVLSADGPRLRHIAHKRMGYLRATYRLFKDTVSETEKDNIALVKLHMKMCVKHYHALIPEKKERNKRIVNREDLRLLKRQLKSQPALPERQINHPQELQQVPGGWATSRQGSDVRASPSSTLTKTMTMASDVGIQLRQVLRNATASSSAGKFGKKNALFEEYLEDHTFRAFYHSRTTQWDILPQDQGMDKEYYRVKESNKGQFAGVRMNYHVWRQRFIATVHSQWRLVSDKEKVCPMPLIKRN
jgi:hypothetical protein